MKKKRKERKKISMIDESNSDCLPMLSEYARVCV